MATHEDHRRHAHALRLAGHPRDHLRPPHRPVRRATGSSASSPSATDTGVEGHAFLGSAMRGAHLDAASLIEVLKPIVLGQDPLDRERLYHALWQRSRSTTAARASAPWTWRYGTWPARWRGCRSTACSARTGTASARTRARPCSAPRRPTARRRRASRPRAGPPTRSIRRPIRTRTSPSAGRVRRAVGDGCTVMLDGSWAYDYPTALRVGSGHRGARLPLVRGPARRRRHLQLRQAQAASPHPDPRHRVLTGRLHGLRPVAPRAGHRLPPRRRGGQGRDHRAASRRRTSPRPST